MGWMQKAAKRAKHDTPEAVVAELAQVQSRLRGELTGAMERAEREIGGLIGRMKELRKVHGLPANDAEYDSVASGLKSGIETVRKAFAPAVKLDPRRN